MSHQVELNGSSTPEQMVTLRDGMGILSQGTWQIFEGHYTTFSDVPSPFFAEPLPMIAIPTLIAGFVWHWAIPLRWPHVTMCSFVSICIGNRMMKTINTWK